MTGSFIYFVMGYACPTIFHLEISKVRQTGISQPNNNLFYFPYIYITVGWT